MRRLLPALVIAGLACAPAARADVITVPGQPGAGPPAYDSVTVERFGPPTARTVLVLVPGAGSGAGAFSLIGPELAERVDGLQVWAADRREHALEDDAGFAAGDPDAALGYYFGARPLPDGRVFAPPRGAEMTFAYRWGASLALGDLRRVVRAALRGGRRVLLGGHGLGATLALLYASWDFGGRPGHRDLHGLVLIDPGGAGERWSLARTREEMAALRASGEPFADTLGAGLPWAGGVLNGLAGLFAQARPDQPAALQSLMPAPLQPPVAVTNQALAAWAWDADTGPLPGHRVDGGGLAAAGSPRGWVDAGATPAARLLSLLARRPPDAFDWLSPRRLAIDAAVAGGLRRSAATDLLQLRPWHARTIALAIYAYETSLTAGRSLARVRGVARRSRVPRLALVDGGPFAHHFDPLAATPAGNRFLITAARFLRAARR